MNAKIYVLFSTPLSLKYIPAVRIDVRFKLQ